MLQIVTGYSERNIAPDSLARTKRALRKCALLLPMLFTATPCGLDPVIYLPELSVNWGSVSTPGVHMEGGMVVDANHMLCLFYDHSGGEVVEEGSFIDPGTLNFVYYGEKVSRRVNGGGLKYSYRIAGPIRFLTVWGGWKAGLWRTTQGNRVIYQFASPVLDIDLRVLGSPLFLNAQCSLIHNLSYVTPQLNLGMLARW